MKRRTLLRTLAALLAGTPLARVRLGAQAAPAIAAASRATLGAVAEVALPSSIGAAGRARVVAAFVAWLDGYRAGADMGHGYGASTLRAPSGPLRLDAYAAQFAALEAAARAAGADSLAALPVDRRRAVVAAALDAAQPATRLPARPTGGHVVADLMGFYFNSPEAWDLAYAAEIRRDACRSLDGSDRRPPRRGAS